MAKTRYILLPLIVVATVVLQMAVPVVARADDGAPPPDQPTEVATDPGTGTTPTDTDTPIPTEVATEVPTESDTATDVASPTVTPVATDAPLMTQVPDGTDVVVVNADGTVEPLATQDAQDIIASSDPEWCPAGVGPEDPSSLTNCYQGATITDLFTNLDGVNDGGNGGTIYFLPFYSGLDSWNITPSSTVYSGVDLTGLSSITLQGGWNGTTGYSGQTLFSGAVWVWGWNGNVTINNISFDDTGATASLVVDADNGTATLQNVYVIGNTAGGGAVISGQTSLPTSVIVSDSDFSKNYVGTGLAINSGGDISLTDVSADQNGGDGASLSANGNISVDGGSFSNNDGTGLDVSSGGNISVGNTSSVTADNNAGGNGATLDNSTGTGDVTVSGGSFSGNGARGLDIHTNGNAVLADDVSTPGAGVDASGNQGSGINIDYSGLGGVSLSDVTAASNNGDGVTIQDAVPAGSVFVDGGYFYDNGGWGLNITSASNISLGSATPVTVGWDAADNALGNTSGGALLFSPFGTITISGGFFDNSGDCPGIEATAGGDITLTSVTAQNNLGEGAILDNRDSGAAVVTISGGNFSENGSYGLDVMSSGDITLTGVTAGWYDTGTSTSYGNGTEGAYLDNTFGGGSVSITGSVFDGNDDTGLYVNTHGTIDVNGTSASWNGYGANLNADDAITFAGDTFSNNNWTGLFAGTSSGAVSLTTVEASSNEYGAVVGTDSGDVSVATSTFNNNTTFDGYGTGLQAGTAVGNVTLTGVVATGNDLGAAAGTYSGNILIDGGTFSGNNSIGLEAGTEAGSVTLTGVTANANGVGSNGIGAVVGVGTYDGPITIDGGTFDDNGAFGLMVLSTGGPTSPVTLDNVEAQGNGLKGAYIEYLGPCGTATGGVDVIVIGGTYTSNAAFGVYGVLGPEGSLTLDTTTPPFGSDNGGQVGPSLYDFYADIGVLACPVPCPDEEKQEDTYNVVNVPEEGGEPVPMDCVTYDGTMLILPDGSKAILVCEINGQATLTTQHGEDLPAPLPAGLTLVSGMTIGLEKDGNPVTVVTEGGYITLSFPIPADKPDAHYTILYWDPAAKGGAGDWVELPPYETRLDGTPIGHSLHPKAEPDDHMRILSGVRTVGDHVKATVNFTGLFILVEK